MSRLSLNKARKHLKQTGINASPETKFRTVIKGANDFQVSNGKLSIPSLDTGEYSLEVFSIEEGNEPERLTYFDFEILSSDIVNSEPEIEIPKTQETFSDPRDKIISFLEKQVESQEKNFQDRLDRELKANDQRWEARINQKDFELSLVKNNQNLLEAERQKISDRLESRLRQENKYKNKPDNFSTIMNTLEKVLPFILPSGDDSLKASALKKAAEMMADMDT